MQVKYNTKKKIQCTYFTIVKTFQIIPDQRCSYIIDINSQEHISNKKKKKSKQLGNKKKSKKDKNTKGVEKIGLGIKKKKEVFKEDGKRVNM